MVFTCGHNFPEPRNMGRGKAREGRLKSYFARPCQDCAIQISIAYSKRFTDIHAVPLEGAALQAAIEKGIARVKARYI